MRSAERRQEVVESSFVRNIDRRKLEVRFELVPAEHVVDTYTDVEQISGRYAWRVVIGIKRSWSGNCDARRAVTARARRDRVAEARILISAMEANGRLLIRG